jgi:hypothetical protein
MRAPVATVVLLLLAVLLYALMMTALVEAPHSDPAGRAISLAFSAMWAGALWLVLIALLIVGAVKGMMPLWGRVGAILLVPLSCAIVWMAIDAYGARDRSAIWPPALLPPLIALYALWACLPSLHARLRSAATGAVLGGAIVLLNLLPLVAAVRASLPDPARDARLAEAAKAEDERMARERQAAREREEGQFASLGPDSSLESYLIYLQSSTYRDRALAGVRQVKNRQADAIGLLQKGRLVDLGDLQRFDLAATPDLCLAYRAALAGAAGKVTKARSDYLAAAIDLEGQLANIRWLIANRCDLGAPLALLEANVRAVADSSRMTKFADTLAELGRLK